MLEVNILKDTHFAEAVDVKVDSKNRITLGKTKLKTNIYKVYRNAIGQIILDPQVTIPAHEQWLFKNKEAADLIKAGLEDARKGRLVKAREDFSKYVN